MTKSFLLMMCLLASIISHAQCHLSFGELELLAQMNAEFIDKTMGEKGFALEKEAEESSIEQKHYFCKTYKQRVEATQLTAIIFQGITRAITFQTVDTAFFNDMLIEMSKTGYHFTHLDENPIEDQPVKMMHYRKGKIEVVTYTYDIFGRLINCCTLAVKQ